MEFKGYSYGYDGKRGMFRTEKAELSMKAMKSLGCNWVSLAFAMNQDTFASTRINFSYKYSVTDKDIEVAINKLHGEGVKVCLKPMVNCLDGVWRANISFPEKEWGEGSYWDIWFDSYTDFLCHYAEIAEENNCEMLCIGCEMLGTEPQEQHWRKLIAKIRGIYSGELVYNTNHGKEMNVKWWDAVDYIGTSAYFPVTDKTGSTAEEMAARWEEHKYNLERLSRHFGKKIIFMEIGCRSASGCAQMPWDFSHTDFPYDEDEQANFFESCFRVFSNEEWFGGFFWWEWHTFLYSQEEARRDRSFGIYGKKAEQVVRKWYTSLP